MDINCYYQSGCRHGFAAAWVVKHWAAGLNLNVVFHPINLGYRPEEVKGKEVVIISMCFPESVMVELLAYANRILIVDNQPDHLPFIDNYRGHNQVDVVYDQHHSLGMLMWRHLLPTTRPSQLLEYIEDRDMQLWKLAGSRQISVALDTYPMSMTTMNEFNSFAGVDRLAKEGGHILRYQNQCIETLLKRGHLIALIGGFRVPVINASFFESEIAYELAERYDCEFGATYYDRPDGKRQFILRSRPEGRDVGELAQRLYNGEGRADTATFAVGAQAGEDMILVEDSRW